MGEKRSCLFLISVCLLGYKLKHQTMIYKKLALARCGSQNGPKKCQPGFLTPSFHSWQARWENCPKYYPSCLNGPRCEKWVPRHGSNATFIH